ncbi:FAD-dependent oxidoreductase [Microtetraspora sp. AC03309]|uniref:NAD(P)/FAD-dependent oxidoreductase n=1 Tax=Microtetraspora sp. AC03309 TaxID=2779376 RepID=UPI001E2E3638|nr:FAD-dependent oxidoreductase [Microtetraspora sp. AC03309]MCC5577428.1 FAD-dependent oxidoreductase [Microtetraspora sp. AC03309]
MKTAIVVGAGIWGTSLALRLAETGWRVTLVEQYAPGHVRQASAGETRLLRAAHGADEWYARMARQARDGWRELGARTGEELYLEAGLMWFARREDGWERASAHVLKNLDIPHEFLDPAEAGRRFPGFKGDDLAFVLYEPEAGLIRARRATQVTARLAVAAGVTLVRARAVPYGDAEGNAGPAIVADGEVLRADRVVWACGGWLPTLFDAEVEVTRQDTLHFDVPREWSTPPLPAFCDYEGSAYGHGDVDGLGMKVTSDVEGEPFDPQEGSRRVLPESEEAARDYLRRRFPSLAGAPVLFSQVCQYTLTRDAEWIIAEVSGGMWLLGGDSGHGFKHAPALAGYVADLLDGRREVDPRFGLHARVPARGLRTSGAT